jgi:hypothetical protein
LPQAGTLKSLIPGRGKRFFFAEVSKPVLGYTYPAMGTSGFSLRYSADTI